MTSSGCPDLRAEAVMNRVVLSSYDTDLGSTVNVTCAQESLALVGLGQLTCLNNGTWSGSLASCLVDSDELSEREKIIIAVGCSLVFVVLVALLVVAVCFFRSKEKTKRKRSERLAATLERLSIRDPLDELVRRESRRSSYGNPAFTSSSFGETDTDRRKLYKIWDNTRTRKQFVFAEGLDELVLKGGEKLNLSGPIRVVLEEDGTEIDNDAVLRACAGMVFLLLEQNQIWTKPEVVLSVHEYSNNLNHYRYDVDEKL